MLKTSRRRRSRLVEQCPVGKSGRGLTSHHTGVTGNRGSKFLSKGTFKYYVITFGGGWE